MLKLVLNVEYTKSHWDENIKECDPYDPNDKKLLDYYVAECVNLNERAKAANEKSYVDQTAEERDICKNIYSVQIQEFDKEGDFVGSVTII